MSVDTDVKLGWPGIIPHEATHIRNVGNLFLQRQGVLRQAVDIVNGSAAATCFVLC